MGDKPKKEGVKNMAETGIFGTLKRRGEARKAEEDGFQAILDEGAARAAKVDSQAVRSLAESLKPDVIRPTIDPNAPPADVADAEGRSLRMARAGLRTPVAGIRSPRSGGVGDEIEN